MEQISRDEFIKHVHDGDGTKRVFSGNVIPVKYLTSTELTTYLSGDAIDGEMFSNFDGSSYKTYLRINNTWQTIGGGGSVAKGTDQAPNTATTQTITCGFTPKLIKITANVSSGTSYNLCIGSATSTSDESCNVIYKYAATILTDNVAGYIIATFDATGSGTSAASISNISSTGFTLSWLDVTVRPFFTWEVIG